MDPLPGCGSTLRITSFNSTWHACKASAIMRPWRRHLTAKIALDLPDPFIVPSSFDLTVAPAMPTLRPFTAVARDERFCLSTTFGYAHISWIVPAVRLHQKRPFSMASWHQCALISRGFTPPAPHLAVGSRQCSACCAGDLSREIIDKYCRLGMSVVGCSKTH